MWRVRERSHVLLGALFTRVQYGIFANRKTSCWLGPSRYNVCFYAIQMQWKATRYLSMSSQASLAELVVPSSVTGSGARILTAPLWRLRKLGFRNMSNVSTE